VAVDEANNADVSAQNDSTTDAHAFPADAARWDIWPVVETIHRTRGAVIIGFSIDFWLRLE